jgi:MFS family permease
MRTVLLVGVCYIVALTAVLTFGVPALRDGGASRGDGSVLFAFVSISAMIARVAWGHLADAGGGRRRAATLRDVGILACASAVLTWAVWPEGTAVRIVALVFLSLGALGFNGVLYLIAGEIAGAARAGQAVALMSTALFGGGALASVPLGALADAEGYRSLWLAAAAASALGVLATLRLDHRPHRESLPD